MQVSAGIRILTTPQWTARLTAELQVLADDRVIAAQTARILRAGDSAPRGAATLRQVYVCAYRTRVRMGDFAPRGAATLRPLCRRR